MKNWIKNLLCNSLDTHTLVKFKWYRRLQGGDWIYEDFVSWRHVNQKQLNYYFNGREDMNNLIIECY